MERSHICTVPKLQRTARKLEVAAEQGLTETDTSSRNCGTLTKPPGVLITKCDSIRGLWYWATFVKSPGDEDVWM